MKSITSIVILILSVGIFNAVCSAEDVKLLTYYPSPTGTYVKCQIGEVGHFLAIEYVGATQIRAPHHSIYGSGQDNIKLSYSNAAGSRGMIVEKDGLNIDGYLKKVDSRCLGQNNYTHVNLGYQGITGSTSQGRNTTAAVVLGGQMNSAYSNYSIVGGGYRNMAGDEIGGTDEGGFNAVFGGRENAAFGLCSTIAGGQENVAGVRDTQRSHSTIGGGYKNIVTGDYGTISGGRGNQIADLIPNATISGGYDNEIAENAGGATICGGHLNRAYGLYSTVAGGGENIVTGEYSFAAGHRARVTNSGAFVWNGVWPLGTNASNGDYTFNVYSNNIFLEAQERVNIKDVLRLVPRAAAPLSPVPGDIYFDGSTNHIMCWLGGPSWVRLDN